jgi:Fe-S oxidoreductase
LLSRYPVVIVVTAVALGIAAYRAWELQRLIRSGKPTIREPRWRAQVGAELKDVVAQRKLLQWTLPGLAHAIVFWGFTVLLLTVLEAWGALFNAKFAIWGIGHVGGIGFVEDFFTCAVIVAVVTFGAIRWKNNPRTLGRASRFDGSHTGSAWLILGMITAVMVTLLVYRAAQVNTGDFPYDNWAFAAHALGAVLRPLGLSANRAIETVGLDANLIIIAVFLVLVVNSKHAHIFLAPINIALSRQPRALGSLAPTPEIDLESIDEDTTFGVNRITDFSWKQLLDFETCTECGRCQSQCPAWATGKPLSPKLLVMGLRDELNRTAAFQRVAAGSGDAAQERDSIVPTVIDPDVLWACTTCGACVEECPVDIEHLDSILDLRRNEVMMKSEFPPEAAAMLRNIESRGDPWGMGSAQRESWTAELAFDVPVVLDAWPADAEYLFWTGCSGALDDRGRRTSQAIARLLHRAGVSFAILGKTESCTGDPARRIGNEYLFQIQAKKNIESLHKAGATKIITSCAHCFNAIGNEYPALGGDFTVVHHAQLLAELVEKAQLVPGSLGDTVITYHDPCYLGRHNRVFDEPRRALDSVQGATRVEMAQSREQSFCCGAGGARMWMEESIGERINIRRAGEAIATGAEIIATACPFCSVMLHDGVQSGDSGSTAQVLDIAQILDATFHDEALVTSPPQGS